MRLGGKPRPKKGRTVHYYRKRPGQIPRMAPLYERGKSTLGDTASRGRPLQQGRDLQQTDDNKYES